MLSELNPFLIGAIGAALIAAVAYALGALSLSGAVAAFLVGTAIFGGGGASASVALLLFFVSGSALSRLPRSVEKQSGLRDWRQVAANGLVPGFCALGYSIFHDSWWALGFYGALATAAADTWATEFGTRFGGRTRDILHWGRPIEPGLSGGVSVAGLLASLAGASVVGVSVFLRLPGMQFIPLNTSSVLLVILSGFIGALLDSILGSALQAKFKCEVCGLTLDNSQHLHPVQLVKGLPWMTNNVVNQITVLVGALLPILAGFGIAR